MIWVELDKTTKLTLMVYLSSPPELAQRSSANYNIDQTTRESSSCLTDCWALNLRMTVDRSHRKVLLNISSMS
jgi:hypothetical protein